MGWNLIAQSMDFIKSWMLFTTLVTSCLNTESTAFLKLDAAEFQSLEKTPIRSGLSLNNFISVRTWDGVKSVLRNIFNSDCVIIPFGSRVTATVLLKSNIQPARQIRASATEVIMSLVGWIARRNVRNILRKWSSSNTTENWLGMRLLENGHKGDKAFL